MRRLPLASAALALWAGAASAQSVAEQVVAGLEAQGFTRIEVDEGPTQVKVEALRGTTRVEYVYDRATGDLLRQEQGTADGDDDTSGVEFERSDDDFVDVGRRGDDDGDDDGEDGDDDEGGDRNRGHGNDADGFDDDNPGRGHGRDRGGDDNRGGGDDDGDDGGDDDGGDDEDGDDDGGDGGRGRGGDR